MEQVPKFASPAEEIAYWKDKAKGFEQQAKEVKEELEEFQEGSKELELELEAQLEQAEKSVKEYKSLANRLQIENDSLKDKLEQCSKEYHYQVLFFTRGLLIANYVNNKITTNKTLKVVVVLNILFKQQSLNR